MINKYTIRQYNNDMYSEYNMDRSLDLAWENYLFKKSGDNVVSWKYFLIRFFFVLIINVMEKII